MSMFYRGTLTEGETQTQTCEEQEEAGTSKTATGKGATSNNGSHDYWSRDPGG